MMFFNQTKRLIGVFVSGALLVSCSDNNTPAVRGGAKSTFYVETLTETGGFVAVGDTNAQGKYNKKLLSLEACLKDNAQTNSISNISFEIVAGEAVLGKKTDYRGCLQWQELIEFDPDDDVRNVMMNRSIVAKESHSGSYKITFAVNAIDNKISNLIREGNYAEAGPSSQVSFKLQQYAHGAEAASGGDSVIYVKIDSRSNNNKLQGRISRQTEIETLSLESKGVDFYNLKLDQNLNIVFPFRYYTRFSISLLKQGLNGIAAEALKRGHFKFYLTVLKESADLNNPKVGDVLGATSFEASPRGDAGLITVPIVLNFSNVTSITNRVNFLFTAVSMDTPARFEDQSFEGFSNGLVANKDLEIKLVPNEASAQGLHDSFVKASEEANKDRTSVADSFVKAGLKKIANPYVKYDVKEAQSVAPVTKYVDFRKVLADLEPGKTLTLEEKRGVCAAHYQTGTKADAFDYQNCLNNPSQVLEASVSEIVESVDPNVSSTASVMDIETLNMTSSFEFTNGTTTANGNSVAGSVGADAEVSYGFPKLIGKLTGWLTGLEPKLSVNASLSGKAYVSRQSEAKQVDGNSAKIIKEKQLTSVPIAVSMNVKVAKCLVIVKKSTTADTTSSSSFYCADARNMTRTEYYYLVDYTRVDKTSSVMDVYSGAVNPFHLLVRGKETYVSLKETLTSTASITTFFLNRIDEKKLDDPSNFMTQSAPLVLSSQRNLLSR